PIGARVFTRSGETWSQEGSELVGQPVITSIVPCTSVALSGDGSIAIVGAISTQYVSLFGGSGYGSDGTAWVFTRSGGVWSQQGRNLIATDASRNGFAEQGSSVAISADGNTVMVGGFNDDYTSGAAWIYVNSGSLAGPYILNDGTGVINGGSY